MIVSPNSLRLKSNYVLSFELATVFREYIIEIDHAVNFMNNTILLINQIEIV